MVGITVRVCRMLIPFAQRRHLGEYFHLGRQRDACLCFNWWCPVTCGFVGVDALRQHDPPFD